MTPKQKGTEKYLNNTCNQNFVIVEGCEIRQLKWCSVGVTCKVSSNNSVEVKHVWYI